MEELSSEVTLGSIKTLHYREASTRSAMFSITTAYGMELSNAASRIILPDENAPPPGRSIFNHAHPYLKLKFSGTQTSLLLYTLTRSFFLFRVSFTFIFLNLPRLFPYCFAFAIICLIIRLYQRKQSTSTCHFVCLCFFVFVCKILKEEEAPYFII